MKAIVLNEYGDSSHLKLAEIPIAKRLPLAEAASAQRLAEAGGIGKALLKV
jgi:NADPH:quinone reductase-like Zn-dependent oxidoreductase